MRPFELPPALAGGTKNNNFPGFSQINENIF